QSFIFSDPQYYTYAWQDWPKSDLSASVVSKDTSRDYRKSFVDYSSELGTNFCPSKYGINPNYNANSLSWFAGSGGLQCNDWTMLPPILIGSIDDMDSSHQYPNPLIEYKDPMGNASNWIHNPNLSIRAYQQSTSYSSIDGDSYSVTFNGFSISRMFAMHTSRGYVDVYMDGFYVVTINDFIALPVRWEMVKTWAASVSGDHTITFIYSYLNYSGYLDLDAFTVNASMALADTYDDQGRWQVIYIGNGWTHGCCYTGAYNQTASFSKTTEDAFEISFTGTCIFYYYPKASILGKAGIVMDGVDRGTIDQYASSTSWNNVWDSGALSNGPHTLHVVVTGTKNPSSTDYWIELDKLVVQ
ncbi:MAG TPA: hypothetical protein VF823_09310, partial [Anaerolineales bacterium]